MMNRILGTEAYRIGLVASLVSALLLVVVVLGQAVERSQAFV